MTNPALRTSITNVLTQIGTSAPVFLSSAGRDRLYEGYVLSLLLTALHRMGCILEVYDGSINPVPSATLNLRRAPGLLYSNQADHGFIMANYQGTLYEVHADLRVSGSSKVLHELDVSILPHQHAQNCRRNRVDPKGAKVRFLCECKCYGANLPLHIGREFLGLCSEFTARTKTIASNTGSNSIRMLVKSHKQVTQFDLYPGQTVNEENFIGWVSKQMEHVL